MERIQNLHKDPYSVDALNSSQSKHIGGVLINLASEASSFFPVLTGILCVVLPKHQKPYNSELPCLPDPSQSLKATENTLRLADDPNCNCITLNVNAKTPFFSKFLIWLRRHTFRPMISQVFTNKPSTYIELDFGEAKTNII